MTFATSRRFTGAGGVRAASLQTSIANSATQPLNWSRSCHSRSQHKGWLHREKLKPAGDYALKLLNEKGSLRYSENFFDGSQEMDRELRAIFGFESHWDVPAIYVDWAVIQLEDAGLVHKHVLAEKMSDGEPDYMIALNNEGKEFIRSGQAFQCRDMDL